MWIVTTIGFYSVVRKPGDALLTVRGRAAADLDRLRDQYMPQLSPTLTGQGTDYPVRATISKKDFTAGMAKLAMAIDYGNFKSEVAHAMGHGRAEVYSDVWSVLKHIEAEPAPTPPSQAPSKRCSYGGVVIRRDGKILLREPKDHFDGYLWTFPKGKPNAGESPEAAALREVMEETGVLTTIVRRIPGEFKGGTGSTVFFLMSPEAEGGKFDDETQAVAWVDAAEAKERIRQTRNRLGRDRDLKVLDAALALRQ